MSERDIYGRYVRRPYNAAPVFDCVSGYNAAMKKWNAIGRKQTKSAIRKRRWKRKLNVFKDTGIKPMTYEQIRANPPQHMRRRRKKVKQSNPWGSLRNHKV